jgi:hypothetical protein
MSIFPSDQITPLFESASPWRQRWNFSFAVHRKFCRRSCDHVSRDPGFVPQRAPLGGCTFLPLASARFPVQAPGRSEPLRTSDPYASPSMIHMRQIALVRLSSCRAFTGRDDTTMPLRQPLVASRRLYVWSSKNKVPTHRPELNT